MRRPAAAPCPLRRHTPLGAAAYLPMAALVLVVLAAVQVVSTAGPSLAARTADRALLDFEWPSGIDVAADGRAWLGMQTDFFSGGARQLDFDLSALGGFATRTHTLGIAVDAAGDILMLQAGGIPGMEDDTTDSIERYLPAGIHRGRVGMHEDILSFDAASEAGSAWALVGPSPTSGGAGEIPEAFRFDDGELAVDGLSTIAGARFIAGAPDGTFYVATATEAEDHRVARFNAEGLALESWTVEHPIRAIDVAAADGAVWVASMPPPMPDLSKTRIQGFPAGGGTPAGTFFADFEMDLDAIDIAAWSASSGAEVQCSVHGVGTFGIGALWTIARHDCEGELLATTREIPWVGIWTPMPTATAAGSETEVPAETPSATPTSTATDEPSTPDPSATDTPTPFPVTPTSTPTPTSTGSAPTPGATETAPLPTDLPEPTAPGPTPPLGIYLPLVFDFALRGELSASTAEPTEPATAESPTVTPPPTLTDVPAPTDTPTPAIHRQVRLQLAHGAGFSLEQLIGGLPSQAPWFVLYDDRVVLRRTSAYGWHATSADDAALAALADGLLLRSDFFDLPAINNDCGIADIGLSYVHAVSEERSHTVRGEGLEMYASDGCVGFPAGTTLAQWRALAEGIETASSHDFGPEIGWTPTAGTLAVARSSMDGPRPWTVPEVSLAAIAPAEEFGYETRALTGTQLTAVFAELGMRASPVQFFEEAGATYAVGLRVEPPGWDAYLAGP